MNMRSAVSRRTERGVAAVEAALILPVIVTFLMVPIYFGVYFWHYTAVQKSAQNAVRYLSMVPAKEFMTPTPANHAEAIAKAMVREGIADLLPAETPLIDVECDDLDCGDGVPTTVRVVVRVRLKDAFFGLVDTGDFGWRIGANVSMRYVGY